MKDNLRTLNDILKTRGYSVTAPRRTIFKSLLDNQPKSMNALIKSVCPAVDRASVYRTINLFERLGIVHKLQAGWKYTLELSDMFSAHHHHVTCIRCGLIVPVEENSVLEHGINKLAVNAGFKEATHTLELRGICSKCQ